MNTVNEEVKDLDLGEEVEAQVEATEEFVPVSKEQIDEWKKEYGKVFMSEIAGDVYIWRRIRRSEYATAITMGEELESIEDRVYLRQVEISKIATLHPLDIEVELKNAGGLAVELAENIILKSGFHQTKLKQL